MDQDQEAPCRQRAVCRRDTCQRRLQAASRPPTRSSACLQPASLCVFSLSVCLSAASLSVCSLSVCLQPLCLSVCRPRSRRW